MYKLGVGHGDEEYVHPALYMIEDADDGENNIFAGLPHGNPKIFKDLVLQLTPPYVLIYILRTQRGKAEPGRYQSLGMSQNEFHVFIDKYGLYLSSDARFDIWAYSPEEDATVVWDHHNFLRAYGPTEKYERLLKEKGFSEGGATIIGAHSFFFRPEFDAMAAALLHEYDWERTPLRPEDEQ